jgi:hypothetical protein
MRNFEDLAVNDQNRLLVAVLYAMSKAHCSSIDELANKNGQSTFDVWRQVCIESGLDQTRLPKRLAHRLKNRS